MINEKKIKKRFHKPYHFLSNVEKQDINCLNEIFKNFHLEDFREELNLWLHIALSNDQSAYDEGCSREDLIDFVQELHRLIETFHTINKKTNSQKKKKINKGLGSVIKHFCHTFKQSYAKIEILDLLDAVIIYVGDKKVYRGNIVLFYQHLHYLVKLAYSICKPKKFMKHYLKYHT